MNLLQEVFCWVLMVGVVLTGGAWAKLRLELQQGVDVLSFEVRPGTKLPIAISIGAAVFPHDGDSYETLLATADSRMYRDKTRRKRQGSPDAAGEGPSTPKAGSLTDGDLKRAAVGIL